MNIKILLLGVISLGVVGGMITQIILLLQTNDSIPAVFLIVGLLSFIGFISFIMKKLFSDLQQGLPSEDEHSKKVKNRAAARAYFYSLYIWIALLAFQKYFDRDDILILGISGMVLALFISWIFTKNKRVME